MKTKITLLSISALDKKGCIYRGTDSEPVHRSYVICGVEDLLNIFNHEKYRYMSLESDDEVEHIVEDSSNSRKEIKIKRESTKQTKISI